MIIVFKEVITLIKTENVSDGAGGYKKKITSERNVFANKSSVKQNEFYLAQQSDLQAEVIFKIYLSDYDDEKTIKHNDDYYSVIRTYIIGDFLEITCQKRIGGLDDILNG